MKPTIHAVLFDAVGTLFHSRGTIGEIYGRLAAQYDFPTDPRLIEAEFARLVRARGTPIEKTAWRSLVAATFANLGPFPRFDEFFEAVYEVFRTSKGWLCYPETIPVLESLRQGNYQLGIVSNFDARLDRVLEDLQIAHYFKTIVTPHTSGYSKPDPRIFLEASTALQVLPEEIVFVGDDFVLDVDAASRAGFHGILVDRGNPIVENSDQVADLKGVLGILDL